MLFRDKVPLNSDSQRVVSYHLRPQISDALDDDHLSPNPAKARSAASTSRLTHITRPISNNQRVVLYTHRSHTSYPRSFVTPFSPAPSITLLLYRFEHQSNLSTSSPFTPRRPVAHFEIVCVVQSPHTRTSYCAQPSTFGWISRRPHCPFRNSRYRSVPRYSFSILHAVPSNLLYS